MRWAWGAITVLSAYEAARVQGVCDQGLIYSFGEEGMQLP